MAILLISILTMAGTWWWKTYRNPPASPLSFSGQIKNLAKSIAVGVGVYFTLLFVALIYLMVITH